MTNFISNCDERGIPKEKPITCSICGFISKNIGGHNSHKGNMHHKGNSDTQHGENLFKSGKYTYE